MAAPIELLDTVALTGDVSALGLTTGEVGVVVEALGNNQAFEVEFCDRLGATYGIHTLLATQLIALHTRGQIRQVLVETI